MNKLLLVAAASGLSFAFSVLSEEYVPAPLSETVSENEVKWVFPLEECRPTKRGALSGTEAEVYSSRFPCNLPKNKMFSSSTIPIAMMYPDRYKCRPNAKQALSSTTTTKCLAEVWSKKISYQRDKLNPEKSTFTVWYERQEIDPQGSKPNSEMKPYPLPLPRRKAG